MSPKSSIGIEALVRIFSSEYSKKCANLTTNYSSSTHYINSSGLN